MTDRVKDFVIRTKLETKDVLKDYKKLLKDMRNAERSILKGTGQVSRGGNITGSSTGRVTKANEKELKSIRKENILNARRLALIKKINTAKDLGLGTKGLSNSLRSNNPELIRKRTLELDKKITEEARKQAQLKSKLQAKEKASAQAAKDRARVEKDRIRVEREASKARVNQERAARRAASTRRGFSSRKETLDVGMEHTLSKLGSGTKNEAINRSRKKLQQLRIELSKVESSRALKKLAKRYQDARVEADKLVRSQQKFNAKLNVTNKLSNKFASSLKHAGLQIASVYAVASAGGAIFRIGKDFDAMRAGLQAASASSEEAIENFEFLKATANRLGTDIEGGTRGFNRMAVAARGAGMSTEDARELFLAVSEASTTFQLDTQRSNLVMLAFSQMTSKAKVSAEELQRQMAEHIPIAMEAAEMATGKTRDEIMTLMKQGKLSSKEFVLPFAKALRTLVRRNDALAKAQKKLTSQQHRMNNAFKIMVDQIFQSKGAAAIGDVFSKIAGVIERISPTVVTFTNAMFDAFGVVMDLASAMHHLLDTVTGSTEGISALGRVWRGFGSVLFSVLAAITGINIGLRTLAGLSDGSISILGENAAPSGAFEVRDRFNNRMSDANQEGKVDPAPKINIENATFHDSADFQNQIANMINYSG